MVAVPSTKASHFATRAVRSAARAGAAPLALARQAIARARDPLGVREMGFDLKVEADDLPGR